MVERRRDAPAGRAQRVTSDNPETTTGSEVPLQLRIAYVVNHYPAVSHSFIRREIHALERQGFAVERYALRGWDSALADPQDEQERRLTRFVLQRRGVAHLVALISELLARPQLFLTALCRATRMANGSDRSLIYHWVYLVEACTIARWSRASGVRHLHAHFGTNSAEVAMLAALLCGYTYSITIHGPDEFDRPLAISLGEKVRHAAFVVAISSYTRSQLFRWVEHCQWSKIHVVHCGLEVEFHSLAPVPTPGAKRLVCVGRLNEQKGHLLLLAAMRKAFDRGCSFDLVLAGDGELRSIIEERARVLGLEANVHITGWISSAEVRAALIAARALVLPSFAEGLPVVIMEAMALFRPVITTYVAGIPELVLAEKTGWLVPAGDADALSDALVDCLRSTPQRLDSMGQLARQRVLVRHDVDVESGKLAGLFRLQLNAPAP